MLHRHSLAALFAALTLCQAASADDVRYYDDNGVTYRETRRVVQRPMSELRYEERQQTVYAERLSTEYQPTSRTVLTPITEYQWEPYMANRWNPFRQPTVNYRYSPHMRWEARNEETHIPITRRELVPEQRVSKVPVLSQRFVPEEHISRVAVGPSSTSTASTAQPIGGVATMQNDPPRQGNAFPASESALMGRR